MADYTQTLENFAVDVYNKITDGSYISDCEIGYLINKYKLQDKLPKEKLLLPFHNYLKYPT